MSVLNLAKKGDFERLEEVLQRDASRVNMKDKKDITPLLAASDMGEEETVEVLLRYGGNVNDADKAGRTPLLCAAAGGYESISSSVSGICACCFGLSSVVLIASFSCSTPRPIPTPWTTLVTPCAIMLCART